MKDLIIVCAGGLGRETANLVDTINRNTPTWNLIGFVDDNKELMGKIINGRPVLGGIDYLLSCKDDIYIILAAGYTKVKKQILDKLETLSSIKYATLIHPHSVICRDARIGEDVIIEANCCISTNVIIGNHVYIGPQCGIGHDSVIKNYSSLFWNVNISGNAAIEEGVLMGTKSCILQGSRAGKWSTIGAMSMVKGSIDSYCTAAGIPAKPLEKK